MAEKDGAKITKARFVESLKGTEDEVYSRLIKAEVKLQSMTGDAWRAVLNKLKGAR